MRSAWARAVLSISTVCLLTALCCSCSESAKTSVKPTGGDAASKTGKKLRIAVIPKGTSHEFWKSVHAGAKKAAAELGDVEIVWKGPAAESDINGQASIVNDMLVQQVDGIVLAPNDAKALVPAVREANADKIPVVIFDSGLSAGAETVSYVATDNENGGRIAARRLAEAIGEEGNVILLRYRSGSESTEMREAGFLKELDEKFPKIKVLSKNQQGEGTVSAAAAVSKQLLQKYGKDVNGVFAVCEPNAVGMLLALQETDLAGKVKFVAFDPASVLLDGLQNDTVHGIVLQDPVSMGYLSVKTLVAHLRGEKVEPRVATGEFLATLENMKSAEIERLLKPEQQE